MTHYIDFLEFQCCLRGAEYHKVTGQFYNKSHHIYPSGYSAGYLLKFWKLYKELVSEAQALQRNAEDTLALAEADFNSGKELGDKPTWSSNKKQKEEHKA